MRVTDAGNKFNTIIKSTLVFNALIFQLLGLIMP